MEIKVRKKGILFDKKICSEVQIDDIIVKEDFTNPEKEKVCIYFRGKESSGIITVGKKESEKLSRSLKSGSNLVKKSKKIRASL